MILSLKILESNQDIQNKILRSLLSQLNSFFNKINKPLTQKLKTIVISAIKSSPEYSSLVSGQLKFELGVPDAAQKIEYLFDIWFSNISITIDTPKIKGSSIKGSINISLIKSDLSDILSSPVASIRDSNTGSIVNWLEWLSIAGDRTIIKGYDVEIGPNRRSRTGNAIMTVSENKKWKVPSAFSGTLNNNWITRAIDSFSDQIEKEILQSLRSSL